MHIQVLTPQDYADDDEVIDFNRKQDFEIIRLPSHPVNIIKWIKRLAAFWDSLGSFQPQLVIASGARAVWISGLCLHLWKTPWVLVGHGTEFGLGSGVSAWLTRWTGNRADAIICVSAYTLKAMQRMGINQPTAYIIHNGADQHSFFTLPDADVTHFRFEAGSEDKFVLLTVGKVSDRKGQEVVIHALPRVLQDYSNVIYWMAGLPENQRKLEAVASELGVLGAIRFWGRVDLDQLHMLYNACDLFVMTSRQLADGDFEGFGIAVLEAGLCGKTALVSDNSGLAEAVKHEVTGIIVPQNDADATAKAILSLIESPRTLKNFGLQAQQHVLENQTWEKVTARYREVLQYVYQDVRKGDT